MNYSELSQAALSQEWAAKYKTTIDAENAVILQARQAQLDAREGIGVGDFVVIAGNDKMQRVAHDWGDLVQLTDGRFGASFYLGDGHLSFSGGLNPGIDKMRFSFTGDRRAGSVWFFSQNQACGHNGFHTEASFKVWTLTGEVVD